jgi:hypothetical protein
MSTGAASGAAAAAAATIQAIKASGVLVKVGPDEFRQILARIAEPLVVHAMAGFFRSSYRYLTSYRGLAFYTTSPVPLELPPAAEVIGAGSIWIPGG